MIQKTSMKNSSGNPLSEEEEKPLLVWHGSYEVLYAIAAYTKSTGYLHISYRQLAVYLKYAFNLNAEVNTIKTKLESAYVKDPSLRIQLFLLGIRALRKQVVQLFDAVLAIAR